MTSRALHTPEALLECLQQVREQGWCVVDQELEQGLLLFAGLALVFALLLLVGLSTLVMILVWDTGYRLTGIICLCVFYTLAAAFCGVRLKAAVFDESTPFHATLEELANDRERLLP